MLLSGIHFGLLYSAFSGKSSNLFRSPVVRYYLLSILAGAIIVTLNIKFSGIYTNWGTAIREGFFQVVSVGTTTGFANGDSSIWPGFSILIIIFFTIQCACSGSTSGGMKADRVLIFFLAVRAQIIKQIHPNAVVGVKMGNQTIDKEVIYSTNLFIVLYILIVFISALFLTGMGTPLLESFSASAACMGNVGPGFGKIGSLGNYASIPFLGKLLLTIQMLLGRLEIYALLLIFALYRRR